MDDDAEEEEDVRFQEWLNERKKKERDEQEAEEEEEEEHRSSDYWSTISAEISEESRYGRTNEDNRDIPVDLEELGLERKSFDDISGSGGVLKKIGFEGVTSGGEGKPEKGFTVEIKYVMRTEEGNVVDVSCNDVWDNKEYKFVIGMREVIEGMDIAVMSMKRREKSRFFIRSDFAFGSEGCPPKILQNVSWLIIDIELMAFRRPYRDKLFLRNNEVMPYVLKRKEQGNAFYRTKEYWKAVHEYKNSLKAIEFVDDPMYKIPLRDVAVSLLSNLSAAHLALANWKRVIKYCSQVLELEPQNEKALFRRSQALREYPDRLEEARKDLAQAIRIAPNNKNIREAYAKVIEEVKKKRKEDREAYGGIFQKDNQIYLEKKPRVFFEISHGKALLGRIEMDLFNQRVPKTAENFRRLCVGDKKTGLSYKGTVFHRVIEDYIIQGGDVTLSNGKGGRSVYGATFEDESLEGKCDKRGLLCMANSGPNTNQSQFFILLAPCPELEGKYVVFGKVVAGFGVLKKMESVECNEATDAPVVPLKVFKCGQVKPKDVMVDSSSSDEENGIQL